MLGGDGPDTCEGRGGDDDVEGAGGDDRLFGGPGDDRMFGRFGDDLMLGNSGDDELEGGRGEDTLRGGEGDDRLNGGFGDDRVDGGPRRRPDHRPRRRQRPRRLRAGHGRRVRRLARPRLAAASRSADALGDYADAARDGTSPPTTTRRAHPDVLAAIAEANAGPPPPYGADPWTARAEELLREHFGEQARSFLVFNGTGANVLCFRAMCRPWESVVCAATAHVNVDEGGAPERIAGVKLHALPTPDGKLTPELVAPQLVRNGDEHAVQPRVVSITQSTELGTRYSPDELAELAAFAHEHDMLLHVDGARLANAAAALDVPLRAIATDAGVDALSFGGTKNGLLLGEAVVLLRPSSPTACVPAQADAAARVQGPLPRRAVRRAARGRPLAAQRRARQRDGRAPRRARSPTCPACGSRRPSQANGVFAVIAAAPRPRSSSATGTSTSGTRPTGEVRWMCSWDTTADDVDAFAAAIRSACAATAAAGAR